MTINIRLEGPDAQQALKELMSNIQYDKLNVRITRVNIKKGK